MQMAAEEVESFLAVVQSDSSAIVGAPRTYGITVGYL
jgi:hypothetical protein